MTRKIWQKCLILWENWAFFLFLWAQMKCSAGNELQNFCSDEKFPGSIVSSNYFVIASQWMFDDFCQNPGYQALAQAFRKKTWTLDPLAQNHCYDQFHTCFYSLQSLCYCVSMNIWWLLSKPRILIVGAIRIIITGVRPEDNGALASESRCH